MKHWRSAAPLLFILALPLSSVPAEKPAALPKDLPPYGPLAPFHAPQVEVRKLDNGLTLWLVPRRGFPKVALVVSVRGGMATDPKELPGLSELLLATVDQGTRTLTAKQIAEAIQAAGGELAGDALSDDMVVRTDVLASRVDSALALLADVFESATFPEDEVALAKRNAADDLRAREAEPRFLARRAMAKAIFGDHPYSVIAPTQDSIAKTRAEGLRSEFARRFRPDQALLVAVGDFDADTLAAEVRRLFGKWQPPKEAAVAIVPQPSQEPLHDIFIVPRPGSVQTSFLLGAFAPTMRDPDFAASEVANAIYGGMFGSRLITNIREDKGYTYSPGAFVQTRRSVGLLLTRADVRNEVTGATLNEIDYELNRMATTSPTLDEMTHAERYLVGVQAIDLQSQESVARRLAMLWSYNLPPEELGRESERIQKVTAEEVNQAGKKYFPAARQTIVAVGDEKAIRQELAPLGIRLRSVPQ